MKIFNNCCSLIFLICLLSNCQQKLTSPFADKKSFVRTNSFKPLKNYPHTSGRNDDVSFISNETGWALNNHGKLSYTATGGKYWFTNIAKEGSYFRSLAFKDSLNGWLGTIGTGQNEWVTDSAALYQTTDEGVTWTPVTFDGPNPKGICGLQVVSDRMIVGSGRVVGPSFFIRSMDGGKTWKSWDMNHMAGALITPYFFDEQNGLLIGGTESDVNRKKSSELVLSTNDGGNSWDTLYVTSQKNEWCWKISFPTRQVGYISVQRNTDKGKFYFLKTTDGGKTWEEKEYTDKKYFVQGIGFINEKVGWIGGGPEYSFETRDGGETWVKTDEMTYVNRFIFTGDMTGYASGASIYKLDSISEQPNGVISNYDNSGHLISKATYKKGKLDGSYEQYDTTGKLIVKGNYKSNLKEGIWVDYENGTKQTVYKENIAQVSEQYLRSKTGLYKFDYNGKERYFHLIFMKGHLYFRSSGNNRYSKSFPDQPNSVRFYSNINVQFRFDDSRPEEIQYFYRDRLFYNCYKLNQQEASKKAKELKISKKLMRWSGITP